MKSIKIYATYAEKEALFTNTYQEFFVSENLNVSSLKELLVDKLLIGHKKVKLNLVEQYNLQSFNFIEKEGYRSWPLNTAGIKENSKIVLFDKEKKVRIQLMDIPQESDQNDDLEEAIALSLGLTVEEYRTSQTAHNATADSVYTNRVNEEFKTAFEIPIDHSKSIEMQTLNASSDKLIKNYRTDKEIIENRIMKILMNTHQRLEVRCIKIIKKNMNELFESVISNNF